MKLLKCSTYLAAVGTLGFLAGRILPEKWVNPQNKWFSGFHFEKHGQIYEKLGIRKWQKRLPDMSKFFPSLMPPKNLSGDFKERLPVMIRETCIAEIIHIAVSLLGLPCLWMWPGAGGITVTAIYILLLNVPYVLIQRYNRPRLVRLQEKISAENAKKEGLACAS